MVLAAALAAGAVLGRTIRGRAYAMLGALVLTPILLVAEIWDSPQIPHRARSRGRDRRRRRGSAWSRSPASRGCSRAGRACSACSPSRRCRFRIPVQAGGSTANLLVPLYVVIGAGALAWLVPRLSSRHQGEPAPRSGALEWVLLAASCSTRCRRSTRRRTSTALQQVVFFYVPFALLFALLRGLEWTPRRLKWGGGRAPRPGARVYRDRVLGVPDAAAAAEPEGDRLQPGRGVLPRQLAVLRPEHLRPLPRAGDDRPGRRAAVAAARARRVARHRCALVVLWGGC